MSEFDEIFGGGWNAREEAAKAAEEYAPVEPGWYQAMIEQPTDGKPMVRDSKAGGKMLKVVYRITGPKAAGRKVFQNINLLVKPRDGSEEAARKAKTAEQIGRRELAKLCMAAGKPLAKDSAELVDAVVEIKVAIGKNYNGDPDNEVKDFRAVGGAAPASFAGAHSAGGGTANFAGTGAGAAAPFAGGGVPADSAPLHAGAARTTANSNGTTGGKLPWM